MTLERRLAKGGPLSLNVNNASALTEEFAKRFGEYQSLCQWIDNRLTVFIRLKEELTSASGSNLDSLLFKTVVEEQRLKEDVMFIKKSDELEKCFATLRHIQSRLSAL